MNFVLEFGGQEGGIDDPKRVLEIRNINRCFKNSLEIGFSDLPVVHINLNIFDLKAFDTN
jgi:hypothetical protein